uniref:Uncharacterized protein n=1 Tax=viral metagenome TaxID=1070528 RepID=A0A6M3Y3Z8_9ZZZZ
MKLLNKDAESEETKEDKDDVETSDSEETTDEAIQPEEESEEQVEDVKDVPDETPRERALRAELKRVKKERSEFKRELAPVSSKEEKDDAVSKAEAIVINSLQQEALEDFLAENPEYNTNDKLWNQFMDEFKDRASIMDAAKRKNISITKSFVKDRLNSIHRSFGTEATGAKEEGKAELLRSQSQAAVAASVKKGQSVDTEGSAPRKRILPDPNKTTGFKSWVKK